MLLPTSCGPGPPPPLTPPPLGGAAASKRTITASAQVAAPPAAILGQVNRSNISSNISATATPMQINKNSFMKRNEVATNNNNNNNKNNINNEENVNNSTTTTTTMSKSKTTNRLDALHGSKKQQKTLSTGDADRLTKTSGSPTGSATKWLLLMMMVFTIMGQESSQVAAEKSKHYYMQSLCKNHFLQQLYRKIDGAVLWSQNERNLNCIITFQTHSVLQRFMLRFDMLQLDCNDHLYVYDGAHAVATPKIDITCRNTKQTVSSLLTHTNFVTLKYVTDGWGTDANGFKLVITSVNDHKHTCKDFTCTSRDFCISPDLLCDGINHCGDNSDESVHNLCQNDDSNTIFGMDMTWFVLIVVSGLLTLSAIVAGISICLCRRHEDAQSNQNTAVQLHTAETNGSSKHLHFYQGGTLSRDHTTTLPGNWHHPAEPSGYYRIPHSLLKMMATKVRPIWCLANSVK